MVDQTNNVNAAIVELKDAINKFPKSTEFQLRNAVKDIDNLFTDVKVILTEMVNTDQTDQEDVDAEAFGFCKNILKEVMDVSSFAKQLVTASAALQREKIARDKWMRENRPELFEDEPETTYFASGDFDHGLVSAALNVVRAIGALCQAATDIVDGEISPEYLIVSAQYVAECCTGLVVASKVQNIDRKGINPNLEKLISASEGIKKITDTIVKKTEDAVHFKDTGATDIKCKLSGNLWKDELNLQDYENKLHEKVRKKYKEIKDRRRHIYATSRTTPGVNSSSRVTEDSISQLMSESSIDSNFRAGLKENVNIELKLKEEIKQTEIVIAKTQKKLEEIRAERKKQSGEESD